MSGGMHARTVGDAGTGVRMNIDVAPGPPSRNGDELHPIRCRRICNIQDVQAVAVALEGVLPGFRIVSPYAVVHVAVLGGVDVDPPQELDVAISSVLVVESPDRISMKAGSVGVDIQEGM